MGSLSEFLKIHLMNDLPKTESKVAPTSRKHNILQENVVSSICPLVYHSSTNLHICTIPCTMYIFFLSTFYHPTLRMYVLFICLVEPHKLLPYLRVHFSFEIIIVLLININMCIFSHKSHLLDFSILLVTKKYFPP